MKQSKALYFIFSRYDKSKQSTVLIYKVTKLVFRDERTLKTLLIHNEVSNFCSTE